MVCQEEDGWEGGGFTSFEFRGSKTEAASKQQVKIVSKYQEREREGEELKTFAWPIQFFGSL